MVLESYLGFYWSMLINICRYFKTHQILRLCLVRLYVFDRSLSEDLVRMHMYLWQLELILLLDLAYRDANRAWISVITVVFGLCMFT